MPLTCFTSAGKTCGSKPLLKRKQQLKALIAKRPRSLFADYLEAEPEDIYAHALQDGT